MGSNDWFIFGPVHFVSAFFFLMTHLTAGDWSDWDVFLPRL